MIDKDVIIRIKTAVPKNEWRSRMAAVLIRKSEKYVRNHTWKGITPIVDTASSACSTARSRPDQRERAASIVYSHEPIGDETDVQAYDCNDVTFVYCDGRRTSSLR